MARIAVIPGDGVGPEVIREAIKVLEALAEIRGRHLEFKAFDFGAERYLRTGESLPPGAVEDLRAHFDAILFGAVGDPRVPEGIHAREILLRLRFELDLYVNLRPVRLLDDRLSPLKGKGREEIDFVLLRENTEGPYVGLGGVFKAGTPDEMAIQEDVNTRKGVERIIRFAFEYARDQGCGSVVMADKSNALPYGHGLWRRVFEEVRRDFREVEARHLYADALAMEMVRAPEEFEVIVTSNLLGDILSDLGAQLQGGMGLAPSANLHPGRLSLFEPVHGSAPTLAGKNRANPMGAILSAGLLLDHLGHPEEAKLVEQAVVKTLQAGKLTPDLGGEASTSEVGDFVAHQVAALARAGV